MHICGTLVVHISLPIFFFLLAQADFFPFVAKASIRDMQVSIEQSAACRDSHHRFSMSLHIIGQLSW